MPDFTPAGLSEADALPPAVLTVCSECIRARRNVRVTGPTGVGKTTLLSALLYFTLFREKRARFFGLNCC